MIASHNRCDLLGGAIESVLAQRMAPDRYELVVVDNASTDGTPALVGGLDDRRVRYVSEPRLGLSHARNAGWRAARGRVVAFLDDDAVATPDWLQRILRAFETRTPRPGCVGGPVEPIWERPRPAWLGDGLLTGLTIVDWGARAHVITDLSREWLVGANLAFQVDVLRDLGGFAAGLDRSGARMLSGGDVHMTMRVQAAGLHCWYDPGIIVRHRIAATRLQKRWFVRRYYAQGLSDAAVDRLESVPGRLARMRKAARLVAGLLSSPSTGLALLMPTDDATRFTRKCFALIRLGHAVGLLARSRASR